MASAKRPEVIAREVHSGYYQAGGGADERHLWTVRTFLGQCQSNRILEVGCGDGRLLELLKLENELYGVDVSRGGVAKCQSKGIQACCLDASSDPLPFPEGFFDFVICLETFEHMMNPYYALMEIRRVLKPGGRLLCSVPNPLWGHILLYPGLFEYKNFSRFLQQCSFRILRVKPWQWAPRETILPTPLRRYRILRSRYVAGVFRLLVERAWRAVGLFPWFCYWLWTFECEKEECALPTILERQAEQTCPR